MINQGLRMMMGRNSTPKGQIVYALTSTLQVGISYQWVCPAGVTQVSAVAVSGGTREYGGGLVYNTFAVTPGATYNIHLSYQNPYGGEASIANSSNEIYYLRTWNRTNDTPKQNNFGYSGGLGGACSGNTTGGGAGGYSGNGGNGGTTLNSSGQNGSGGGGGGGCYSYFMVWNEELQQDEEVLFYGNGGGVGILGQGSNGIGGSASSIESANGNPGSGGSGTLYGGGGIAYTGFPAVRIMWGNNRSYPSTNVANQ